MEFEHKTKVTIIGSGNLATHFCKSYLQDKVTILHIIGRNSKEIEVLAKETKATFSLTYDEIPEDTEFVVICVSDKEISNVIEKIPNGKYAVVHTSGSTSIEVFNNKFDDFGVVYPLQTFTKEKTLKLKTVPFFIEAKNPESLPLIRRLAKCYSDNIWEADSAKRKEIHLSAVFAGNFVNHLLVLAKKILEEENLPLEILHPLIKETIEKALLYAPEKVQTGPAVREDLITMNLHLDLLEEKKEIQEIYRLLSQSIIKHKTDVSGNKL